MNTPGLIGWVAPIAASGDNAAMEAFFALSYDNLLERRAQNRGDFSVRTTSRTWTTYPPPVQPRPHAPIEFKSGITSHVAIAA